MVDDLRKRLDNTEEARQRAEQSQEKAFAELSRLTLLLTHPPKPEPEAQPAPAPPPTANPNPRRSFWAAFKGWFLAGLVALLVVIAALAASSVGLLWKPSS